MNPSAGTRFGLLRTGGEGMKRIVFVFVFTCFVGLVIAQESEVRRVGSFRGVKAGEGIDVYLTKGDKESLRVEVSNATRFTNVVTEVSGTYLNIYIRDGRSLRNINAKVYVTYVNVNKIYARSAAKIYSEGILKTGSLEIGCSSAGSVVLTLDVEDLELSVSSAGKVELDGKVRKAVFEVSSAGQIDAYNLEVETVRVEAASAGSAKIHATKELEARASSGASIRYKGSPSRSRTDSSSGGSVKKSD